MSPVSRIQSIKINLAGMVNHRGGTFYTILGAQVDLSVFICIMNMYICNFVQKLAKFLRRTVKVFNISLN